MKELRIVTLGCGTGRQKTVLERWTIIPNCRGVRVLPSIKTSSLCLDVCLQLHQRPTAVSPLTAWVLLGGWGGTPQRKLAGGGAGLGAGPAAQRARVRGGRRRAGGLTLLSVRTLLKSPLDF
jgi:hypothetical protein